MVPADPNLTSEVAVPLPPGTRVHDHVIEQWLRSVPDGYIYRVIHAHTGAVAALHEYLPAAWAFRDAEGVMAKPGRGREFQVGLRRFLLRARQLRELEHPALPKLIEAWPSHGTACILTTPASTKTLSDVVIAAGGRLPLDQAWPWLCACCDLAEWLHQQGKIHGSWDPETIGVTDDDCLILPMPEVDGPAHPASPWMPLEQTALAPKGVQRGPWTDVFGISGLAAFMLTGQSPATARRQPTAPLINTAPRASRTSASAQTLPRAMMAAIRVSLLPNARQRPQDIAQLKAMMGLFATAPVLSEELKAASLVPEAAPAGSRSGWVMPAQPGPSLEAARPSGFGELPTEPMPLRSSGDSGPMPLLFEERSANAQPKPSGLEGTRAYRELAAWEGEEPLPPPPALRRRLSAGAAAAGAALVGLAAIWVVVAERPPTAQVAVPAVESVVNRDIDRVLKASPPAAGQRPADPAALPVTTVPSTGGASPTANAQASPPQPSVVQSVPAQAPVADAALPDRTGAVSSVPALQAPASPMTAAAPTSSEGDKAKPAANNPSNRTARPEPQNPARETALAAPPTRPSCSQLLLEQSLGARVAPADLRNCR